MNCVLHSVKQNSFHTGHKSDNVHSFVYSNSFVIIKLHNVTMQGFFFLFFSFISHNFLFIYYKNLFFSSLYLLKKMKKIWENKRKKTLVNFATIQLKSALNCHFYIKRNLFSICIKYIYIYVSTNILHSGFSIQTCAS